LIFSVSRGVGFGPGPVKGDDEARLAGRLEGGRPSRNSGEAGRHFAHSARTLDANGPSSTQIDAGKKKNQSASSSLFNPAAGHNPIPSVEVQVAISCGW